MAEGGMHNLLLAGHLGACENRYLSADHAVPAAQRREPAAILSQEFSRSMRIIPLGPNVVVRRMEAEEKTSGGIVLPDAARKKPRQGRVLSVGDGQIRKDGQRSKPLVNEGDRVLFSPYAGTEVQFNSEELLILHEDEILAVLP
jgi:chaperonin GroES